MGMFDTVWVPCPSCGTRSGFQSKSGPCKLEEHELDDAPPEILVDVNRHAPATCTQCSTRFMVHVKLIALAKSVEYHDPPEDKNV